MLSDVVEEEEVGTSGVLLLLDGEGGVRQLPLLLLILLLLYLLSCRSITYWSYGPKATIQTLRQLCLENRLSTSSVRGGGKGIKESFDPRCPVPCSSSELSFNSASPLSAGAVSVAVAVIIALKDNEEKDENLLLFIILVRAPDQMGRLFL